MSPDVKEAMDYLIAFLAPGAAGGIILALFGWLKARSEKPHITQPQVGGGALAQIGGMVMGQQTAQDIIEALRSIAASHDRYTLARETEVEVTKRLHAERREYEMQIARDRHEDMRQIADILRTLNDRLRDVRLSA